MKRYIKRIIIIFFGIFCALWLSIVADQVLGYVVNKSGYFKAMTPNITEIHDTNEFNVTSKISSQGLRNKEVEIPKPKDTYRILAIGDSFTFGVGVKPEEAWPKLLEKSITIPGKKLEIVNAGKPAAAPVNTRHICKAYKDQFEVDVVIWGMYEDDLAQAATGNLGREEEPINNFIQDTWSTFTRLENRIIDYRRWGNIKEGQRVITSEKNKKKIEEILKKDPRLLLKVNSTLRTDFLKGKINPALILGSINNPDSYTYFLDKSNFEYALKAVEERLEKLKDRCTKDLPVFIVFIPSAEVVSEHYFTFKEELGYNVDKSLTILDLDIYLKPLVQKLGFIYLSPLKDFRKDGCTNCYYPYDGHLTPEGQKRLAFYSQSIIRQELLKLNK